MVTTLFLKYLDHEMQEIETKILVKQTCKPKQDVLKKKPTLISFNPLPLPTLEYSYEIKSGGVFMLFLNYNENNYHLNTYFTHLRCRRSKYTMSRNSWWILQELWVDLRNVVLQVRTRITYRQPCSVAKLLTKSDFLCITQFLYSVSVGEEG